MAAITCPLPGTEIVHLKSNRLLLWVTSLPQVSCTGRSMLIGYTKCWNDARTTSASFGDQIGLLYARHVFRLDPGAFVSKSPREANYPQSPRQRAFRRCIRTAGRCLMSTLREWTMEWMIRRRILCYILLPCVFDHPVAALGPSEYRASRKWRIPSHLWHSYWRKETWLAQEYSLING